MSRTQAKRAALLPVPPGAPPRPEGDPPRFGRMVPLEWVVVDPAFNLRTSGFGETDLDQLGQSLQTGGQLQPCLGERLVTGQILLISGHRRFAAAKRAGLKTLWLEGWDQKAPPIERLIAHAADNIARRELTPAERAEVFERLGKVWQESLPNHSQHKIDNMIALRCAASPKTVGQYRRFMQKLHVDVLAAWKASPELIPVQWLDQVVKLGHPDQLKALASLRARVQTSQLPKDGGEGGGGTKSPRPTQKKLHALLQMLETRDTTGFAPELSAEVAAGVILGLKVALGEARIESRGGAISLEDASPLSPLTPFKPAAKTTAPVSPAVPYEDPVPEFEEAS